MSERYVGAWEQAGLFNPLNAPTPNYTYYLYAWGLNSSGQLGLGNRTNYSSPVQVGLLTNWSAGAPYSNGTAYIKNDGTLWTWGANAYGALGLGNTTYYSSPKQVGALTNWAKVSPGSFFCLALKTDG